MRKEQRKGRRTEPEATSTHSQPQLPRKGETPDLDNLWSNRKSKASLPDCPVAKGKSMALCTEVHAGPQTLGPRAGLQEGGWGWRMTADPHLFSIRICTLCTRSRASCRICFALCRSAISERGETLVSSLRVYRWETGPAPDVDSRVLAPQSDSGRRQAPADRPRHPHLWKEDCNIVTRSLFHNTTMETKRPCQVRLC